MVQTRIVSAEARQETLVACPCELVQSIGLGDGTVVLPQLDVGVRLVRELGSQADRPSIAVDGQRRAGREVDADADA